MKTTDKQRGAALIVGLMMLVVVTLLAVTAVSTSSTELVMAGNEQFRDRAFQAAEAGVESAIRKARTGDSGVPMHYGDYLDINSVAMASDSTDSHSTRLEAAGAKTPIGDSSKLMGLIYKITTTGVSARNSQSAHEVQTWVLSPYDDKTFDSMTGPISDGSGSNFGTF